MGHLLFINVLLTEIFPKATRIGLGLGGGSCKEKEKSYQFIRIYQI